MKSSDLPKREPDELCNARLRSRRGYCKRPGRGGRCKLHGGASPQGPDHPAYIHGRYAKVKSQRIRELAEKFENDPNPLDLKSELAMHRALLADYLERAQDPEDKAIEYAPETANRLLSEISKVAKRIEDIHAHNAISRPDFYRVLTEMGRVVDLVISDDELRKRIHDGWMDIRLA